MRFLFSLTLLALAGNAWAMNCASRADATEIGSRYVLRGALAFDRKTRLTWQRCGHGQHYRGDRCLGALKPLTLDEARRAAREAGKGWRVPAVEELASLIKKKCSAPMLNRQVFPDVTEIAEGMAKYWSSTRDKDMPMLTYNIDFIAAGFDANTAGIRMGVRLVRSERHPD